MDKISMQMNEDGNLSTGSLYQLNQQAYDRVKPLTPLKKKEQLSNLYEWVKEQRCDYVMLLCHERRDYTVLRFKTREDQKYKNGIYTDLLECLENRGKILDVRYLQDQDAWEIWLRIFGDKSHQNHMYMFFNAEEFIVEV